MTARDTSAATPEDTSGDVDVYLSRSEVAEFIGVKSIHSLSGMNMPEPDIIVGNHKGWKKSTIEAWHASRPGRGNWGQR
ncbi:helix-turn-helix DNA-binding protein [Mycobacterium phage Bernardo]|uniref:Helix-turn-helix DNA-binding protein n=1 Tax=Mycobacterium phage Bernardo TaxID=1429903 RepID=V5R8X2_9CAUD|nr:DNA binding protein [Mycobacterium phage Bernardo]AHB31721.1 helix-turn-helix DNA-binding protein [Mycobacterium phage Bernardo]